VAPFITVSRLLLPVFLFSQSLVDAISTLCFDKGTVWAWGSNIYGQLGDGTYTGRYTPAQVSAIKHVGRLESRSYGYFALVGIQ